MTTKPPGEPRSPGLASIVAIVGPPLAGKSTVAEQLQNDELAHVFQLEPFVRDGCRDGWLHPNALACLDPYTDSGTADLDTVLHAAFLEGRFAVSTGRVVIDGFPYTAAHLRMLRDISRASGARLAVIELGAADANLARRCLGRSTCLVCTPDHSLTAYQQAPPDRAFAEPCPTCKAPTMIRVVDDSAVFRERLRQYRSRRDGLQDAADTHGVPWVFIDTSPPPATYMVQVRAAVARSDGRPPPPQPRLGSR
jgi:adenylate kinase family enzyme